MTTKQKQIRFDFGMFLLITGAISNVTIWIGAFVSTETQGAVTVWVRQVFLPILGGISGLAMGITVAAGLVFVLSKLADMKPSFERKVRGKDEYKSTVNIRYYGAWGAIVLLLVISPALLAPYVYMTISGAESLFAVLGTTWGGWWSVGRIVAADLAMGAIALVHGVRVSAFAQSSTATSTSESATDSKGSSKKINSTPMQSAKKTRKCEVPGCEVEYAWPQGKGGHYKKYHPDLVIQKGIPAKVSLPIKNEVEK